MKLFSDAVPAHPDALGLVSSTEFQELLSQVLAKMPGLAMAVNRADDPVSEAEASDVGQIRLLLIEADLDQTEAMLAVESLIMRLSGRVSVIVVAADVKSDATRRLFRAGAADVLGFPLAKEDLTSALMSAIIEDDEQDSSSAGQVISVQKCGGGVGASMLVANLGHLISETEIPDLSAHPKVLLLDLDPQFGSLATITDTQSPTTLMDLITAGDRLDDVLLRGSVQTLDDQIDLLPAPDDILPFSALSNGFVTRLLKAARTYYDFILIDLPQNWGVQTHEVLSQSDAVILMMEPNVAHTLRAQAILRGLREMSLDTNNTCLVVNKAMGLQHSDRIAHIKKVFERPLETIPFNEKIHRAAREQSKFLSSISGSRSQMKALASISAHVMKLLGVSMSTQHADSGRSIFSNLPKSLQRS